MLYSPDLPQIQLSCASCSHVIGLKVYATTYGNNSIFDNWKLCINQISVPVGGFIKINVHVSAISAFKNFHAQ